MSVTIVLPTNLSFHQESALINEIVRAGGTVVLLETAETFEKVVKRRRNIAFAGQAKPAGETCTR